jgi:hypothetical protein
MTEDIKLLCNLVQSQEYIVRKLSAYGHAQGDGFSQLHQVVEMAHEIITILKHSLLIEQRIVVLHERTITVERSFEFRIKDALLVQFLSNIHLRLRLKDLHWQDLLQSWEHWCLISKRLLCLYRLSVDGVE